MRETEGEEERRKTTQKNENDNKSYKATRRSILEGETCGGELKQELTNWLQRKKIQVSLHLLFSVAGHARDVAPGLEHDFGDAGRKCIVSLSTATAAAAAGGPHAGGALVSFNSAVELLCDSVIVMCCFCCSHDSSG